MRTLLLALMLCLCLPCWAGEKGITGGLDGPDRNALLLEANADFVRFPVAWDQIEPTPNHFRWAVYDQMLDDLSANLPGVQLVVTIRVRAAGADSLPSDLARYRRFVQLLAQHGRGHIYAYQVGNEVDWWGFWTGSAAEYVKLLATASPAIRAGDPTAKVVMAGFSSDGLMVPALLSEHYSIPQIAEALGKSTLPGARQTDAFIREVLRNGVRYVDVVDAHTYHACWTIAPRVNWLKRWGKEVWNTETGGPDSVVCEWSEAEQAHQVAARLSAAWQCGATLVAWLGLYEMTPETVRFEQMGLVTREGRRKPAFYAFRDAVR